VAPLPAAPAYPLYCQGLLSQHLWRFLTHRMTRAGRWLVWPTVALGLVGGMSLDLQGYVIVLYLLGFWGVAFLVAVLPAPQVTLGARHAERICAGETLPIEYLVDIFAAGPVLYHLTVGQSLACLDEILDLLACVDSTPDEPFTVLTPAIAQLLGKITLVICIFLDWTASRQRFVEELAQAGVAVKVIVVRDAAPTLDPQSVPWPGGIPVVSAAEYTAGVEVL
jgi:hypothetical protein